MSTIYERIKARRIELGMTAEELATKMGYKDKSSISKIEKGKADIPQSKVLAFARALDTTTAYLMGVTVTSNIPAGFEPMPAMKRIPVIGSIACGVPILAEQNIEFEASVPEEWHASFCLRCKGDSMEPRIKEGDLVAIRQQELVENGEIAAVRIGDEATLKHVYLYKNYIELRPENPAYASIIRAREEMNDVHVEGKVVGLCRGM